MTPTPEERAEFVLNAELHPHKSKYDMIVEQVREAEKLSIGEYTLSPYRALDGGFWIEHDSGEGMQVSAKVLAEWLQKFYQENF